MLLYGKVYLRWKKEKIFKPWTNLVKLCTLEFFIYLFCSIIIKIIIFFLLSVLHNSLFIRIMTILVAHKQITQNVYYKQEILNNRCRMGFFFYTLTRYVSNTFFRQGMCPNSCPQSFVSPWSKRSYYKRRLFDKSGYGTGYVVYQILNLSNNQ